MPQDQTFARDLGYLAKFFDNLRRHADSLETNAGARLRTLIDEEVVRWEEIKALIFGGDPGDTQSPDPGNPGAPEPEEGYRPNPFTVGSLIGT
jgi:hypothetical protein